MTRRGQAEMVGLILIVLLLAVGFLLYLSFAFDDQEEGPVRERLGSSFVTSLLHSELDCPDGRASVRQLLQEIARGEARCPGNGKTTEERLSAHLSLMLERSDWLFGRHYNLSLMRRIGDRLEPLDPAALPPLTSPRYERPCTPRTPGVTLDHQQAELYPQPGSVELRLHLCPG